MGTRPGSARPPRDRRPGRAGKNPPPIYKPTKTGRGTRHQPGTPTRDCCPMVAATRAARRGKFRLASRYVRMSLRLITARMA
jgi:hypothetical protein